MLEEIINQTILFIVSFGANLMASVSGGGAGFVQFPVLILLGLPFSAALGTHKVAVVFLGIGALSKAKKTFSFDRQVVYAMLIGCLAVTCGSLFIIRVNSAKAEVVLGLITVLSGIYTLVKKQFGDVKAGGERSVLRLLVGYVLLFLVGLFSGSLSSGAGLFATLTLVSVFRLDLKKAIMHTMVFVATLWNAVGAFTIGAVATIHWQWVPTMITASFLGAYLGTFLLQTLPVKTVRVILSLVAMCSGMLLIYTGCVGMQH
ncbi:MAG: sulfite exporter TauE/SafE family protein [Succinivibrio sp.]|nr:sulfite exporter TauE/SafE family protein [Succinivibrio sp.]